MKLDHAAGPIRSASAHRHIPNRRFVTRWTRNLMMLPVVVLARTDGIVPFLQRG